MNPIYLRFLIPIILLAFIIVPASAQYQLQNVQVTPDAESLPSGTFVNTSMTIVIIPPGPTTTFVEWDNLILSTELAEPRWNVAVFDNDHQVVVTPAEGAKVTVPGYLLAHDVKKNVSVHVKLDGQVPPSPYQQPFTVLKVEELNDRGEIVSGPPEMLTRIASSPTTPLQPLTTTQGYTQPPTQPTIAGVSVIPLIVTLLTALAIYKWMK